MKSRFVDHDEVNVRSLNLKVSSDKMYRSSSARFLKSEFERPMTGRSTPNVNFEGLS